MAQEQLAYKVKTFAQLTDSSERFIKQQIYDGNLKAIKKGGHWWIPAEAARAYLALGNSQNKEAQDNQVDSFQAAERVEHVRRELAWLLHRFCPRVALGLGGAIRALAVMLTAPIGEGRVAI